jgi:hypothetical protein
MSRKLKSGLKTVLFREACLIPGGTGTKSFCTRGDVAEDEKPSGLVEIWSLFEFCSRGRGGLGIPLQSPLERLIALLT